MYAIIHHTHVLFCTWAAVWNLHTKNTRSPIVPYVACWWYNSVDCSSTDIQKGICKYTTISMPLVSSTVQKYVTLPDQFQQTFYILSCLSFWWDIQQTHVTWDQLIAQFQQLHNHTCFEQWDLHSYSILTMHHRKYVEHVLVLLYPNSSHLYSKDHSSPSLLHIKNTWWNTQLQ